MSFKQSIKATYANTEQRSIPPGRRAVLFLQATKVDVFFDANGTNTNTEVIPELGALIVLTSGTASLVKVWIYPGGTTRWVDPTVLSGPAVRWF